MNAAIDSVLRDLHHAVRYFRRSPMAAAVVLLVLSLGIGANATLFSVIRSFTTRPAPGVTAHDALVRVRGTERPASSDRLVPRGLSVPEYQAVAAQKTLFSATAAWIDHDVVVEAGGRTEAARAQLVAGDYFGILGVRLALGSPAPSQLADAIPAAVIGYSMWQVLFGGAADILGKHVTVNGLAVTIVGVAPERFGGAIQSGSRQTLWLPLGTRTLLGIGSGSAFVSPDTMLLSAVARLQPGVSVGQASVATGSLAANAVRDISDDHVRSADVVPLRGDTDLFGSSEMVLVISVLGFVATLILLIACTNASAILVGLGIARRHEITIRLSLGASRRRIVRQLLTESSVLAVAAGVTGLAVYWWSTRLLVHRLPNVELSPDVPTIVLTVGLALLVGIVCGLSPALQSTRQSLSHALKVKSGAVSPGSRLQRSFVVAQIALTQPLLVGLVALLGVAMDSATTASHHPLDERILSLRVEAHRHRYVRQRGVDTVDHNAAALRALRDRIAALPGVEGVIPTWSGARVSEVVAARNAASARASTGVAVRIQPAAPGYLDLMGIPLLRGRDFAPHDTAGDALAVIVGSDLAETLWGRDDPIGRWLDEAPRSGGTGLTAVVVGVADVSRLSGSDYGRSLLLVGRNLGQTEEGMLIRTARPAAAMISAVRDLAGKSLPQLGIAELATLAELERARRADAIRISAATAAAGVLALLLAAIGLYGMISVAVEQRRREVGIRTALGARPHQILAQFLTAGLRLSAVGLAIGLPLSVVSLGALVGIFQIPAPSLPVVGLTITTVVLGITVLATAIPAAKAAATDSLLALRSD
jgi:predicted permease